MNYKNPVFWIILIAVILCITFVLCLLTDPFSDNDLSEKLSVSMDMAVTVHNRSDKTDGNFVTTDYDVLKVSKSANKTTVYAFVLYEEYSFDGININLECGSHIPTAVTFDTSGGSDMSAYDVIEYWEPRDGSYYADDIKSKFPWDIRKKAFDVSGADLQHKKCFQAASEYYSVLNNNDADSYLDELKSKYPEYFDLPTDKGLDVYVWQMSQDDFSCAVLPGTNGERNNEQLWNLKGTTVSEMKVILSTYDIPEQSISIIPFCNPISSYAYPVNTSYRKMLKDMFFGA